MKLKELQDAMIAAMKAKDKFRKDAISALVSPADFRRGHAIRRAFGFDDSALADVQSDVVIPSEALNL